MIVVFLRPAFSINAAHNTHANNAIMEAGVEIDNRTSGFQPWNAAIIGTIVFRPSTVIPVIKNSITISKPITVQPFVPKL